MVAGFIYVMSNCSMPGIVKIGKTFRHPSDRAKDLHSSGVAAPFKVEFAMFVQNMDRFEQCVHDELEDCRVSDRREFFAIDPDSATMRIIDLYVYDFDKSICDIDLTIDTGDIAWYCNLSSLDPPDIPQAINLISEDEWIDLGRRVISRRERRMLEREREVMRSHGR